VAEEPENSIIYTAASPLDVPTLYHNDVLVYSLYVGLQVANVLTLAICFPPKAVRGTCRTGHTNRALTIKRKDVDCLIMEYFVLVEFPATRISLSSPTAITAMQLNQVLPPPRNDPRLSPVDQNNASNHQLRVGPFHSRERHGSSATCTRFCYTRGACHPQASKWPEAPLTSAQTSQCLQQAGPTHCAKTCCDSGFSVCIVTCENVNCCLLRRPAELQYAQFYTEFICFSDMPWSFNPASVACARRANHSSLSSICFEEDFVQVFGRINHSYPSKMQSVNRSTRTQATTLHKTSTFKHKEPHRKHHLHGGTTHKACC
jgi:hypothetical protein